MALKLPGVSLPNLCQNYALLISLITAQMLVTVLWLLTLHQHTWITYGLWSAYIQTIVIFHCAVLCLLRQFIKQQLSPFWGIIFVVGIGSLSIILVESIAAVLMVVERSPGRAWIPWTHFVAMALTSLLMLQVFRLLDVIDARSKAEALSRIHALQAKIKPHFLFNSLNTISELAATAPEKAEEAIQDLSMLFRVSLEEGEDIHSLAKELKLCDRYLKLESWRFAEAPKFNKSIDVAKPQNIAVPKLLLQPLIENALKYGVAAGLTAKHAGIALSIKETPTLVSIKLRNRFVPGAVVEKGNGMALQNTRERLDVMYQDQHSFKITRFEDRFEVSIQIPKQQP